MHIQANDELAGADVTEQQLAESNEPQFTEAVADGLLPSGYAADDGAGLHWVDGQLRGAIAEREGARVARFTASDEPASGGLVIEQLTPEVL